MPPSPALPCCNRKVRRSLTEELRRAWAPDHGSWQPQWSPLAGFGVPGQVRFPCRRPWRLYERQRATWGQQCCARGRWSGWPLRGRRIGEASKPGPPAPGTPIGSERPYPEASRRRQRMMLMAWWLMARRLFLVDRRDSSAQLPLAPPATLLEPLAGQACTTCSTTLIAILLAHSKVMFRPIGSKLMAGSGAGFVGLVSPPDMRCILPAGRRIGPGWAAVPSGLMTPRCRASMTSRRAVGRSLS